MRFVNCRGLFISKVYGKTSGLSKSETAGLERLYRRKIPQGEIITLEFARTITRLTHELGRAYPSLSTGRGRRAAFAVTLA